MNKQQLTTLELLQELKQKIANNQIGFWVENQDCYLWENTFHYSNKVKVGDLSQTREKWLANWMIELKKYYQESEINRKFLEKKFQQISDVDLIEELKRRENIKLSMYSGHTNVYIEVADIEVKTGAYLPIEIKEKAHE